MGAWHLLTYRHGASPSAADQTWTSPSHLELFLVSYTPAIQSVLGSVFPLKCQASASSQRKIEPYFIWSACFPARSSELSFSMFCP